MARLQKRIALSRSLLALVALTLGPQAVWATASDGFPWSNMPTESSGDGAYIMEDSYGSMRDSNMAPDQVPLNETVPGARAASPGSNNEPVSFRQAGQMPFTPAQNNANAPALTPEAGSYTRNGSGFIPTAVDNVVGPLNALPGNVPVRGGEVVPGSIVSGAGVSNGVDSTQSGPGAAGLFTPAGPGNAAALAAQMSGGLQGAPIVDGAGTNLEITVPVATPESDSPDYEQFTNAGTTGLMRDTVYSTGPVPGETLSRGNRLVPEPTTDFTPQAPDEDNSSTDDLGTMADAQGQNQIQLKVAGKVSNTAQIAHASSPVAHPIRTASEPTKQIGAVTGAIDWGNGDVTLFGTQGELDEDKDNVGTLVLNSGATKSVRGQEQKVHAIEEHM